ncbi:MAG: response regulator [Deltaproteobacteria bacterium]|nr:response regulator [Deltaproteobacteria bacterium]
MQTKILIVDDQPEIRELIKVTLRIDNYAIFEADNGLDAILIANRERPDVVLLDIMLPGDIDGYEVCRRLKTNPDTTYIKVLMLTAKGRAIDREKGLKVGADDYFAKPFSPLELVNRVQQLMAAD